MIAVWAKVILPTMGKQLAVQPKSLALTANFVLVLMFRSFPIDELETQVPT